jgi:hypothetical protein
MKNYKQDWLSPLRYKLLPVAIVAATILFYECGSALYMPTSSDAQRVGAPLSTVMQGRTLYVKNCASCHNLYPPQSYTASEWRDNVNNMQKRAKINDAEKETILKYLSTKSRN